MTRQLSWQSRIYLGFSRVSEPLWRFALSRREKRGKEDANRVGEKLGFANTLRPEGPVVWFHALSVGESLALIPLLEIILKRHPEITVLLTTSTRSSADALSKQNLPERLIHQMLPVDAAGPIHRFLDHWKPAAAIISELDLWPALLFALRQSKIPAALINSRISDKNFNKRKKGRAIFQDTLAGLNPVLAQDDLSRDRFIYFGVDPDVTKVTGALKGAPRPLSADEAELAKLREAIGDRSIWLAASIEGREDLSIVEAHQAVCKAHPDALLIFAPRHLTDLDPLRDALSATFNHVTQRSSGEIPNKNTEVYLADTMGEMGLWYRLAQVTFMGHSLNVSGTELRGKNPFEAAVLETALLHGPCVVDFSETYALFDEERAATMVEDAAGLAANIIAMFDPANRETSVENANRVLEQTAKVLDQTYDELKPLLE